MKNKLPNPFQTWKQFKKQAKSFANNHGFSIVFSDDYDIYNVVPETFKKQKGLYDYFKNKYSKKFT